MQAGDVIWKQQAPAEIAVKAVAPYAELVEAPSPGSSRRPFPFMKPAMEWFQGKFLQVMVKEIKRAFV